MSIFGWSYPPGCSGPPDDGPQFCEVCNGDIDNEECICPECPTCGCHGDPDCYVDSKTTKDAGHWLTRSPEQIAQHLRLWEEWKKRNDADEERYALEAQAAALREDYIFDEDEY